MKAKKLTTLLMAVVMVIAAAFTLAACDLLGRGDNGDDPTGGNNNNNTTNNNNNENNNNNNGNNNNNTGDKNYMGGTAPYSKALENIIDFAFNSDKEISLRFVVKKYDNDVLKETTDIRLDAKGGNQYWRIKTTYTESVKEEEVKYLKNANGKYNRYDLGKNGWALFPIEFDVDLVKASAKGLLNYFYLMANAYGFKDNMADFVEGSKTIVGRQCEKYVHKDYYNTGMDMPILWIETQYGFTLGSTGYAENNRFREEFECTKLELSGVDAITAPEA